MDIRDIFWGDDSAEFDENLMCYFIDSPELSNLVKMRKRIIVGRKGAGKSALRKKLLATLDKSINIELMPDENIIRSICIDERLKEDIGNEILFQYVWLVHIYDKIFEALAQNYHGKAVNGSKAYVLDYIKVQDRYNNDLIELLSNLLEKIKVKGGNFGDFGINIEKKVIDFTNCKSMEYHLNNVLKGEKEVVIFIDDLDLGWNNSEISNRLLLGLLSAVNHLKKLPVKIHTFLFIRDDMYKILMSLTQHSDKFRDAMYIKWDYKRLEDFIYERIRFNYLDNDEEIPEEVIFSVFPTNVGKPKTLRWMFERTLSRPRELLQLCRIYTENLKDNAPDSETMKDIEKMYSDWKLQDVCNEFKNKYPGLDLFFEIWKKKLYRIKYHMKNSEFNDRIKTVFDSLDIDVIWYKSCKEKDDYEKLLNILYEIGFIGDYIKGGDGGNKTIYSNDESHGPLFNEIQIHPCFRKAVGTVTRIR